jgi:hypothetical protein
MMIRPFRVYLKKGESLTLEFRRFEIEGNSFTLYDSLDNPVKEEAFLSLDNVAAVIPEKQMESDSRFKVYLKSGEMFEIVAELFKADQPPSVKFYRQRYPREDEEIKNIYVALSEVVAIMPVWGLKRQW